MMFPNRVFCLCVFLYISLKCGKYAIPVHTAKQKGAHHKLKEVADSCREVINMKVHGIFSYHWEKKKKKDEIMNFHTRFEGQIVY